jgi:hypothetical protein
MRCGKYAAKSAAIPPPREYPMILKPSGVQDKGEEVMASRISVVYNLESCGRSGESEYPRPKRSIRITRQPFPTRIWAMLPTDTQGVEIP